MLSETERMMPELANVFPGFAEKAYFVHAETNELWFHATNVCRIFGYANTSASLSLHCDEDERLMEVVNGRAVWFVSESGCYGLALASKESVAKDFKRWLKHDLLPTIRRQGFFLPENMTESQDEMAAKVLADRKALYDSRRVELKKDGKYTEMTVLKQGKREYHAYLGQGAEISKVNPQVVIIPSGPSQWTIDPDTPLKEAYSSFCTYSRRADKWHWTKTELEEWIHLNWPMP